MKNISFVVLGPIEDKTSRRTMCKIFTCILCFMKQALYYDTCDTSFIVTKILEKLNKPSGPKLSESGCLMLVITPAESKNFFKFTLQDRYVLSGFL